MFNCAKTGPSPSAFCGRKLAACFCVFKEVTWNSIFSWDWHWFSLQQRFALYSDTKTKTDGEVKITLSQRLGIFTENNSERSHCHFER